MANCQGCRVSVFTEKKKATQLEFWIAADQVVSPAQSGFYAKLEETLQIAARCADSMSIRAFL